MSWLQARQQELSIIPSRPNGLDVELHRLDPLIAISLEVKSDINQGREDIQHPYLGDQSFFTDSLSFSVKTVRENMKEGKKLNIEELLPRNTERKEITKENGVKKVNTTKVSLP